MSGRLRIIAILAVVALTIGALVLVFSIYNPTPPRTVVFATGPAGSAYDEFAQEYRRIFADNGIELQLVPTAGAVENLERLLDPDSGVDAAFLSMGAGRGAAELESIGGMFFEPLWFFHRDLDFSAGFVAGIAGKTLSIGPPGSAGNAAARILFELNDIDPSAAELVEIPQLEAVQGLEDGRIDALFISSAATSAIVRRLLGNKELTLQGFRRADAYTARFPALTKLVVPAGLGSLADDLPPEDVELIAQTAIIGVRKDLHSAIQSLLLEAASQVHNRPDPFHASGTFPAPVSDHVPLSDAAQRYYKSGRPFLQRYLPFWLAVLVMQLFVAAIPIVGVVYPAVRLLPDFFDWTMRQRIFRLYAELRNVETRAAATTVDEIGKTGQQLLDDLDALDRKVRDMRMPSSFMSLTYALRSHINIARSRISQKIERSGAAD